MKDVRTEADDVHDVYAVTDAVAAAALRRGSGLNGPPPGLALHVDADDTGIVVTRDSPSLGPLVREAIVLPLLLLILGVALSLFMATAVRLHSWVLVPGVLVGAYFWIRGVRDLAQNGGVVIRVEVRGADFVWTKRNLWGDAVYRWPLESIENVSVGAMILKVHSRGRFPMGAFAYFPLAHLEWVASVLRDYCRCG
jgi:hypothetical protein